MIRLASRNLAPLPSPALSTGHAEWPAGRRRAVCSSHSILPRSRTRVRARDPTAPEPHEPGLTPPTDEASNGSPPSSQRHAVSGWASTHEGDISPAGTGQILVESTIHPRPPAWRHPADWGRSQLRI